MPAEVELGMVPEVADPGTISPGLEPAVVVEEPVVVVVDAVERMVAGCDVRPVLEFGSVGVARSCALGFDKGVGGWPVVVPGCVEPGVPDENTEVELWVKFGAELGAAGVLGAGEVLRADLLDGELLRPRWLKPRLTLRHRRAPAPQSWW